MQILIWFLQIACLFLESRDLGALPHIALMFETENTLLQLKVIWEIFILSLQIPLVKLLFYFLDKHPRDIRLQVHSPSDSNKQL